MSLRFESASFRRSIPRVAAITCLLALGATGCNETYTWTSSISGTDSVAALQVNNGNFTLYVCSGPGDLTTPFGRWFEGEVDDSNSYQKYDGTWGVSGYVQSDYSWAQIDGPGTSLFVDFIEANDDISGIYETLDSGCRTGAVVWVDASGETQLQGVWCNDKGDFLQVTPVLPITKTDQGIAVTVDLAGAGLEGTKELYLTRAQ